MKNVFILLVSLFSLNVFASEEASVFLYEEPVEGVYTNGWSGVSLNVAGSQVEVYINGDGKTVDFDGVLSINCENGKYLWKTASNFGESESAELEVPAEVIAKATEVFCAMDNTNDPSEVD